MTCDCLLRICQIHWSLTGRINRLFLILVFEEYRNESPVKPTPTPEGSKARPRILHRPDQQRSYKSPACLKLKSHICRPLPADNDLEYPLRNTKSYAVWAGHRVEIPIPVNTLMTGSR